MHRRESDIRLEGGKSESRSSQKVGMTAQGNQVIASKELE